MENNKTDKCKYEGEPKYQNKIDAEIKLELREYFDNHIRNIRDLEGNLQQRFEQRIKDYKQDLEDTIKRYAKIVTAVVTIMTLIGGGVIYRAYKQAISRGIEKGGKQIQDQISSRLDQEFKTKRIRGIIENAAKKYIKEEAEVFLSDKIEKLLVPLEEKMKLYNIADKAEGGSKAAYLELQKVAKREKGDIAMIAKTKLISIKRTLDIYSIIPGVYPNITYKKPSGDIPIEMMSFDEVINVMENDPNMTTIYRAACMVYISHKPDKEILQKALQVLETSDSLPTCAAFMGVLYNKVGPDAAFLDFENWIKICREKLKN